MLKVTETRSQEVFQRLKAVCVPLLGASLLSPASIPNVSKLLGQLIIILRDIKTSDFTLTTSLISYTFFPLSTLLRRNTASDIPDQILEKVFVAMSILCEEWWWDCDLAVWEQIFMLCGAILGGIEGKGKGKDRDEETKQAAAQCLLALLRQKEPNEGLTHPSCDGAQERLDFFKAHARSSKFLPIFGQTLDAVLTTVEARHLPLQRVSLDVLWLFIDVYAADDLIPTVLPGVISRMTKVALGSSKSKGWANGEIVARALTVMESAVVRAVGDDICTKEGTIKVVVDLEDFAQLATDLPDNPSDRDAPPYSTSRTPSWLRGTSSQLLIAMNTLTPLVSHPTPSALHALLKFSATTIHATSLTLPHAQPLLLHLLLSLSNSDVPSVSIESRKSLIGLFATPSKAQHPLLQTLMRITSDNLSALPRLLPTHADTKVEHAAGLVEAACRLATTEGGLQGLTGISTGIGKLLGPSGGVEKWGWSLLSVLEFVEPTITAARTSSAQLMLESNPDTSQWAPFPELAFQNVFSSGTHDALERMFRALGRAAGDTCLFSVEWFANVGRSGTGSRSVAATWCACRLLEGVADISLLQGITGDAIAGRCSKRLAKLARTLARTIAELWDEPSNGEASPLAQNDIRDEDPGNNLLIQHVKGVVPIHENLRITTSSRTKEVASAQQPVLHKALSLQLLAVSAGVLQAQFTPLFIYTLYPVLHSLVSSDVYLSSAALATLNFITIVTSYASPSNLLLANFDYALDAVSRRLSRRWLDVDATKVLALMVRLVGSDVVEKAGDVVEECFDRLDEYHGYGVIVEGLVEVLGEVVTVIKDYAQVGPSDLSRSSSTSREPKRHESLDDFFEWFAHRHDQPKPDTTDYGPAPHEAWGTSKASEPNAADGDNPPETEAEPDAEPPPTPVQALTKQIVSRSLYFLTHESPVIRTRVLMLLSSSVAVLPESAILPSIHSAWPFILNRLGDPESFVVSATASLIEALVTRFGSFMFRRIWDDVWPRFRTLLNNLDAADSTSALSRRGYGAVGTESAYTHSHRLYKSLIKTMTAAARGVHPHDASNWQVLLAFRRFLHRNAHEELQHCTRDLYLALGENNADAVWLVLSSTMDERYPAMKFLRAKHWDLDVNVAFIFQSLGI
ncbi:TEL2-interacting protein 1 [Hypsizygus marmoreus]|uniref:TEL2-interacting protein 1 n=1 Tax=Hypsizygus marmoreus TaxID=39966 RepID=A0A369K2Q6_HYPMA|nr:TEL2-interacting protein 1 [Hypsizygus marmoreus]